jgi:hypothetical protein
LAVHFEIVTVAKRPKFLVLVMLVDWALLGGGLVVEELTFLLLMKEQLKAFAFVHGILRLVVGGRSCSRFGPADSIIGVCGGLDAMVVQQVSESLGMMMVWRGRKPI